MGRDYFPYNGYFCRYIEKSETKGVTNMNQEHIFISCKPGSEGGEIIDLSAIRTDSEFNVKEEFHSKIKPSNGVSPAFAELTGYTPEKWKDAVTFGDAITGLKKTLLDDKSDRYVVVAYSAEIESNYLRKNAASANIEFPFGKRAWVDLSQLAWLLVYSKQVESRKLTHIASYYGVSIEKSHTAKGDCMILFNVFQHMVMRFGVGQKIEGKIREVTGDVMEGLFSLAGKIGQAQGKK